MSNYRDRLKARIQDNEKVQEERKSNFVKRDTDFFKIADGETKKIRMLTTAEQAPLIAVHSVWEGNKATKTLCMAQFGQHCDECDELGDPTPNLVLLMFDYSLVGQVVKSAKTNKDYPVNPIVVFHRTPGKKSANHYQILSFDENYKGLNSRDFLIQRIGTGTDTTYQFFPMDKEDFVAPPLDELHQKTIDQILDAVEANDRKTIYELVMKTFPLPPKVKEYPDVDLHDMLAEEVA